MYRVLLILSAFIASSCSSTIYIVRHAEKEAQAGSVMSADVPLSAAGHARAEALKEKLDGKVALVYSTKTQRTMATGMPLAKAVGTDVKVYDHRNVALLDSLARSKKNILLVGHSNTVDDLVNHFMKQSMLQDLAETEYGDLFILKRRGNKFSYTRSHFGK